MISNERGLTCVNSFDWGHDTILLNGTRIVSVGEQGGAVTLGKRWSGQWSLSRVWS